MSTNLTVVRKNIPVLYFTYELTHRDFALFFFLILISCMTIEQSGCELLKLMLHPTPDLAVFCWHAEQVAPLWSACSALEFLTLKSWKRESSSYSQIILNTTVRKFHIQRLICMGNFVFVSSEREQGTIGVGMEITSSWHRISAHSEFRITWC